MEKVGIAIQRVTDIMGEIASASHEQIRGIEQINQAITQMDEVTQQYAALVEEAAAAAGSLEHQAQQLRTAVSVFRTACTWAGGFATQCWINRYLKLRHQRGVAFIVVSSAYQAWPISLMPLPKARRCGNAAEIGLLYSVSHEETRSLRRWRCNLDASLEASACDGKVPLGR